MNKSPKIVGRELGARLLQHPLYLGMLRGNLERQMFNNFLAQDYYYICGWERALQHGQSIYPRLEIFYVATLKYLNSYSEVCRTVCGMGISQLMAYPPNQATVNAVRNMEASIVESSVAAVAALLPCASSFVVLSEDETRLPDHELYAGWLTYLRCDQALQYEESLLKVLEQCCRDEPEALKEAVPVSKRTSDLELAFWDAAYEGAATLRQS